MGFWTGTEGTPGAHGTDTAYLDDYKDYKGIRDQQIDYWGGAMNWDESEASKNFASSILENDYSQLEAEYLGQPGNRGNSYMGLAEQMDAQGGVDKSFSNSRDASQQLMLKKQAARAAMNKYRMEYMGESAMRAPEGMNDMAQGPRGEAFPWQTDAVPGQQGFLQKSAGKLMDSAIDVGKTWATGGMNKIGDMASSWMGNGVSGNNPDNLGARNGPMQIGGSY
jgi:hypothetical protein